MLLDVIKVALLFSVDLAKYAQQTQSVLYYISFFLLPVSSTSAGANGNECLTFGGK